MARPGGHGVSGRSMASRWRQSLWAAPGARPGVPGWGRPRRHSTAATRCRGRPARGLGGKWP
eukprot:12407909-Alexandrium_andersonii.AAC.1